MQQGSQLKVYVEFGPVEVVLVEQLDLVDIPHSRVGEPGEQVERKVEFLIPDKKPHALARQAQHFSL